MSTKLFRGYGVKGFRSFASKEIAFVGPMGQFHLLTGQNNSGKSALLDFAYRVLPCLRNGSLMPGDVNLFVAADRPQSSSNEHSYIVSLAFDRDKLVAQDLNGLEKRNNREQLNCMLSSPAFLRGSDDSLCWIDIEIPSSAGDKYAAQKIQCSANQFDSYLKLNLEVNLHDMSLDMHSHAGSDIDNFNSVILGAVPWHSLPETIKIEAVRRAGYSKDSDAGHSINGAGLSSKLLTLKNPKREALKESEERYRRLIKFVRDVLNDQSAEINVPVDATEISVKMQGADYLPLDCLGTGIEELIIIAAVVACNSEKLICIEEPEIHLHPALQAKLAQYLIDDNRNDYLLTTHSQTFINASSASITHVSKHDGVSHTREINNAVDSRSVLDDLGIHPADLLQANFIIWVEGPSDRIYINYWLSKVDPTFVEGVHYSVMLYGGKLLSSLDSGLPTSSDELINLFRINTHFCILMDSDKQGPRKKINDTKRRIVEQCFESGALPLVTAYRTIENYVPGGVLAEAIRRLYPKHSFDHPLDDKWICPLDFKFTNTQTRPDKIRIARIVVSAGFDLDYKLDKQMHQLVDAIYQANGEEQAIQRH